MNNVSNTVLVYAFRYSYHAYRQTGAILDTTNAIKDNIGNFKKWELEQMIGELSTELRLFPDHVNRNIVLNFISYLTNYMMENTVE